MSERENISASKVKLAHLGQTIEEFTDNLLNSITMIDQHFSKAKASHKNLQIEKAKEVKSNSEQASSPKESWLGLWQANDEIAVQHHLEFDTDIALLLNTQFSDLKFDVRQDQPWDLMMQNLLFDGFYRLVCL